VPQREDTTTGTRERERERLCHRTIQWGGL